MKQVNLEEIKQKNITQQIVDTIGFCEAYGDDFGTLIDNNGYNFIDEYLSVDKGLDVNSEITIKSYVVNEISYAYFFQWLIDELNKGRKISEIGLMEAFLCGTRACSRFPKYPVLFYILYMYLLKTTGSDIDISVLDNIYNQVVEENTGIPFKIQDCDKNLDIIKAIKLIGDKI